MAPRPSGSGGKSGDDMCCCCQGHSLKCKTSSTMNCGELDREDCELTDPCCNGDDDHPVKYCSSSACKKMANPAYKRPSRAKPVVGAKRGRGEAIPDEEQPQPGWPRPEPGLRAYFSLFANNAFDGLAQSIEQSAAHAGLDEQGLVAEAMMHAAARATQRLHARRAQQEQHEEQPPEQEPQQPPPRQPTPQQPPPQQSRPQPPQQPRPQPQQQQPPQQQPPQPQPVPPWSEPAGGATTCGGPGSAARRRQHSEPQDQV